MVEIFINNTEVAHFIKDKNTHIIDYQNFELQNSIALSLPNTKRFYAYEHRFVPFLESFLPEGYLYELFKQLLTKEYGYIDDYLIFSYLASNITARVRFQSDFKKLDFDFFSIENILQNDSEDTFKKLLDNFLHKNAISGVQPKTVALLQEKETLHVKEYIIKTWGDEYPNLAENEYYCLKACQRARIKIPNIRLSKNKRFLIVENFIFHGDEVLGFEEILSLMDKIKSTNMMAVMNKLQRLSISFAPTKESL